MKYHYQRKSVQASFCLLVLCFVSFCAGCATELNMRGIHNINDIQIQPPTKPLRLVGLSSKEATLNLNVDVEVDDASLRQYDFRWIPVLQNKIESALVATLDGQNIFQNVNADSGRRGDIDLSATFYFSHRAFDDVQWLPVSCVTGFLVTPAHVNTTGTARVSMRSSLTDFKTTRVFSASGSGRTTSGIAGHGDAVALAIEDVSTKLISQIEAFAANEYPQYMLIARKTQHEKKASPSPIVTTPKTYEPPTRIQAEEQREQVHANCDLKIRDLLNSGEHVALCINMSEPNNTCPFDQDRIENWKKAMTDEVGNFYENVVFSYYNKFENFTLVDRNNLINVLKEHQLSQSGLTNKETRIEVGKLVGINYLVNIGYNRYCILPRVNDITTIKIIEIETGKIVAVDTITNKQIYNPKSLQLEIIKTILNGQEVVMGSDGRTLYRK